VLDTGSDDEIEMARLYCRRTVERSLHRGSTLSVDRRGANGLGPACDEHRPAADVQRLLTDLGHASHLDVFDLSWIEADPIEESVQHLRGELVRADVRERAVSTPIGERTASTMYAS
jgi:hypothetical protein